MVPDWVIFADGLPRVFQQDIADIRSDQLLDSHYMKTVRVLEKWHRSNSFMATYKNLIEVSLTLGDAVLATNICKIIKCGTTD